MIRKLLYALALCSAVSTAAFAEFIGSWLVLTAQDVITDQNNVTMTTFSNSGIFSLRCSRGSLNIVFTRKNSTYREGDNFTVELRVDKNAVFNGIDATAVGNEFLEIDDIDPDFINQLTSGKQIALRVTGQSVWTLVFPISGTAKAIVPVLKACPPAKPADKES